MNAKMLPLCLPLLLAACASSEKVVVDAATTPLTDLNVIRVDIPAVLDRAKAHPYAVPQEDGCPVLLAELAELDAALGPDVDAPEEDEPDPTLLQRGSEEVGKAAIKVVRSAAEDVVPFRSWLRKLSGAERHSKKVSKAIAAGTIRRAFLKGLMVAKHCELPSPTLPSPSTPMTAPASAPTNESETPVTPPVQP
ncbi:hypothetical protein [Permianibacter fluminis]|uniref:hypothetical protein n=1 Tax=Permianibacter fluminis TaxID=2738515 RepID=UPI001B7D858A|nr:hypothetical protein [Permianibacter fluminis]